MTPSSLRPVLVLLAVAALLAGAPAARAQGSGAGSSSDGGTLSLSLGDALARARAQNMRVRQAEAAAEAARARTRQTLAAYLPRLTAREQGVRTNNPLNAFGILLQQERVAQADFNPARLNDPDALTNFSTEVTVEQPIFQPEGFFDRKAAARAAGAARAQASRAEAEIAFRVKQTYFGLVLARERQGVIATALEAARANRDQAQALFDEGVINRADLLAARVRVADLRSQQTEARAARAEAADRLRYLLNVEDDVTVDPTTPLQRTDADTDAIRLARVNDERSDMRALRLRREAAEAQVRARKASFLPTLGAVGGYMFNDEGPFGTQGESWMIGARLTWTPFAGMQHVGAAQEAAAERRAADLALRDQALLNQVEIAAARRNLGAARERLDLAAEAVGQAEESLRIRTDRFAEGLARTTDVLQAEASLAEQRLRRLQTLYEHNLVVYRLELLTEQPLTEMSKAK